ncbi:MAG: hypothetical protein U9Q90_04705 [Campylobacterota bacterium]|nr:hypothetical protein [Campylobacterota bacterium]
MKRIKVLKAGEAEVQPFVPVSFNQNEEFLSSMKIIEFMRTQNSKKEIRKVAEKRGLPYDDEKILFAKKIISNMLDEISDTK